MVAVFMLLSLASTSERHAHLVPPILGHTLEIHISLATFTPNANPYFWRSVCIGIGLLTPLDSCRRVPVSSLMHVELHLLLKMNSTNVSIYTRLGHKYFWLQRAVNELQAAKALVPLSLRSSLRPDGVSRIEQGSP
jgi:hypothetical protein